MAEGERANILRDAFHRWVHDGTLPRRSSGRLVPGGEPKALDAVIRRRADVFFYSVVVQFANGKWGVFRVDRRDGKLVIVELPPVLDNERPRDLSLY